MQQNKKSPPIPMNPFQSIQEAVDRLGSYSHQPKENPTDKHNTVEASVQGNIFRAFRGLDTKPSGIFREWANLNYPNLHDSLQKVKNQEEYDKLIMRNSHSLIDWWDSKVKNKNQRIGFGPASKMVNLLVKTIQQREAERVEGLETFMHVPFDQYTLAPLRFIINELVYVRYNIPIAPTSTMKFVVNEELYQVLQAAVRKISMQAKRDPIIYDYMCWDNQH